MKFFLDRECTRPASPWLDFGSVLVGMDKARITLYLKNDSDAVLRDINVSVEGGDENLQVKAPKILGPNQIAEVTFTWEPTLFTKPLDAHIEVTANEVASG